MDGPPIFRTHGGIRFVRAGARGEHKISSSLCKSNEHFNSPMPGLAENPCRISRLVSATTSALASQGPSVLSSQPSFSFKEKPANASEKVLSSTE